ncbi:hypothetical protein [Rhizobium sp. C1]|uniref:hypothetical protein n=1 Tax=Rhizobium sp. C1 TaxID=1349799 RepID=UPI001E4AFD63|nr:hypothetical protein [Rhizobium sp. C1]MCD2179043.1 hypothetical protein [Rhizobium sp. C1]
MAEKGRAAKLKRLVAVQRHMERIAELELAETTQRRQMLSARMGEAIEAIGSFNPVHTGMKSQYAAQYGRLSGEDQNLIEVQDAQEKQILREKAKGDRLEENWKEARSAEDREREDNAVIDLIEMRLSMPAPASSKLGEG